MLKSTSSRTPSYRRHRASGQAVVTLHGRDHYLGKYGTAASHKRYDQLLTEWLSAGRQLFNRSESVGGSTVAELLAA